ncbi:hypothetical protein [Caballeronia sp. dw_19]|uniref:hypothetical protein n=1 Tax=Caballeronia sp. dw_19 TaxID=2719791 RepID=UPI001BD3C8E6|nr:hypothetical protein [Caballeronia sp. dw_19]
MKAVLLALDTSSRFSHDRLDPNGFRIAELAQTEVQQLTAIATFLHPPVGMRGGQGEDRHVTMVSRNALSARFITQIGAR